MNHSSSEPSTPSSESREQAVDVSADREAHADKYNDPRAKITTRGIAIGIGVVVLGIFGAVLSIYGRKTRLEQTTGFWGPEAITALQLAERLELRPRGEATFAPVNLSGTPGLGHLRRLLLDERNYDWSTVASGDALENCGDPGEQQPRCVQLRLTDPTAHRFDPVEIDIDLQTAWLGPSDGSQRVRLLDRVQPKLVNYFSTIITVQQRRSDVR
jgi:hypothetical protein